MSFNKARIQVKTSTDSKAVEVFTGYTLSNTPFYFTIKWLAQDGDRVNYSSDQILWDFGDGTLYKGASAEYYYKWPGVYSPKAYIYDLFGKSYEVVTLNELTVYNVMPDQVVMVNPSNVNSKSLYYLPAGKKSVPLNVYRYNSWQNDFYLKNKNYTVYFYASGSESNFVSKENYYKSKWSHLKNYHAFVESRIIDNYFTQNIITDSTETDSTSVFALPYNNGTKNNDWSIRFNFYPYQVTGSVFCGTSGQIPYYKKIHYIDQTPNSPDYSNMVLLYANFNSNKSVDKGIVESKLKLHNVISPNGYINFGSSLQGLKVSYNPAESIAISSNGITYEGPTQYYPTSSYNYSFDIYPIKWTNTEIPFFISLKDSENYTTKCYPSFEEFSSTNSNILTGEFSPFIKLIDKENNDIDISNYEIYKNEEVPSFKNGSYFPGIIKAKEELNDVKIKAEILISEPSTVSNSIPNFGYTLQPGLKVMRKFSKLVTFNFDSNNNLNRKFGLNYSTYNIPNSGVYAISYAPINYANKGDFNIVYICDADRDKIYSLSDEGVLLSEIDLKAASYIDPNTLKKTIVNFRGNLNTAAPAFAAIDGEGNCWVPLYDSLLAVKVSYASDFIVASAYPNLQNKEIYADKSSYITLASILSGFAGENSILPTCAETDTKNNVWISYSHPVSSFLVKYNQSGDIQKVIPFAPLLSVEDIIIDNRDNMYVSVINYDNKSTGIIERKDFIYRYSSKDNYKTPLIIGNKTNENLNLVGSMTLDIGQNLWFSHRNNILCQVKASFDNSSYKITSYVIGAPESGVDYEHNFAAIGGDTEGYIWIVDNSTGYIFFFDTNNPKNILLDDDNIGKSPLPGFSLRVYPDLQAFYNYIGDWTGIRWISKYVTGSGGGSSRIIEGVSKPFSILKPKQLLSFKNEDYDYYGTVRSYIGQEKLENSNNLLEGFLKPILVGQEKYNHELGKRIYEKVSNFVDNNSNIDTCEVDALKSIYQMVGNNDISFKEYYYPYELRQTIDALSIKRSLLFGTKATFTNNFVSTAYYYDIFSNLGAKMNIRTDTFVAGDPIIAQEKFTGKYRTIYNTLVPYGNYKFGDNIPLSGVRTDWGWGLVVGNHVSGVDVGNYYYFYRFNKPSGLKIVDNYIDFDSSLTTLTPYASSNYEWTKFGGYMDNILSMSLYKGLQIIK